MNRPIHLLRLSPQAAGDLHQQHTKAIAELRATVRFNKELNNRLMSMIGPDALRTLRKDVEHALLLADLVKEDDQAHVLYVVCAKPRPSDESTCTHASEGSGSDRSQTDLKAQAALNRSSSWSNAKKINSLCYKAVGITVPRGTTEAPVSQGKLREAASYVATLIAPNRTPAQPMVGDKALSQICDKPFQSERPVKELHRFPNAREPSPCHRPFTTLELEALQSLVEPEEWFGLDRLSDQAWRERIGNALPPPAARANAHCMGTTLLLADAGETFMLSSLPVQVRPVAVASSVSLQGAMQ